MLKIFLSLILLIPMIVYPQHPGKIHGVVKDSLSGEPLIGVRVVLLNTKYSASSGINGKFVINNIQDGSYRLSAAYLGYKTLVLDNIVVENNNTTKVNIKLQTLPERKIIPPDSASISFWFYASPKNIISQNNIKIEYQDALFKYLINGSEFFTGKQRHTPHTKNYETGRNKSALINFSLKDNNESIFEGSLQLPLKKDWDWGLSFHITDKNPVKVCFGCLGYKAFPINPKYRESENDSLYVIWGGNHISEKIIY